MKLKDKLLAVEKEAQEKQRKEDEKIAKEEKQKREKHLVWLRKEIEKQLLELPKKLEELAQKSIHEYSFSTEETELYEEMYKKFAEENGLTFNSESYWVERHSDPDGPSWDAHGEVRITLKW